MSRPSTSLTANEVPHPFEDNLAFSAAGVAGGGRMGQRWIPLALLIVVAIWLGLILNGKWFPHDEGALGQSAERVLAGEVPHRDFDELYTGLLSYLNAAAFAVGGIRASVMRLPLFVAALVWVGLTFSIARRFTTAAGAAFLSLTAFAWALPAYPAPLPSWYNLFCATCGLWALFRWQETRNSRWLMLAGAAGGVSFLFKLSGVFYLLGAGLAVIAAGDEPPAVARAARPTRRAALAIAALLATVLVGLSVPVLRSGPTEAARLLTPLALVVMSVSVLEWRRSEGSNERRLRSVADRLLYLSIGAACPVLSFAFVLVIYGGFASALRGVFVTPFLRVSYAATHPPSILLATGSLAIGGLLLRPVRGTDARLIAGAVGAFLGLVLAGADRLPALYSIGWYLGWGLPLVLAVSAAHLALHRSRIEQQRSQMALSASIVATFVTLVEFPFSAPIYTLYALPLTMVAFAAVIQAHRTAAVELKVVILTFFLAFGACRIAPGTVGALGVSFMPGSETAELTMPRGGLRVRPSQAALYNSMIPFVRNLAKGGTMWAGPDAPEVYFLSGIPNRTRVLFEFLDTSVGGNVALSARVLQMRPTVVVLNRKPGFSPPPDEGSIEDIRRAYQNARQFERFLVLW